MDPPLFMWRLTILLTARARMSTRVWVELAWIEDTHMFCSCHITNNFSDRGEESRILVFFDFLK